MLAIYRQGLSLPLWSKEGTMQLPRLRHRSKRRRSLREVSKLSSFHIPYSWFRKSREKPVKSVLCKSRHPVKCFFHHTTHDMRAIWVSVRMYANFEVLRALWNLLEMIALCTSRLMVVLIGITDQQQQHQSIVTPLKSYNVCHPHLNRHQSSFVLDPGFLHFSAASGRGL